MVTFTARAISAVLLVPACAWVVASQTANAQSDVWTSNGPYGGSVLDLAIHPEEPATVYAGTGNGVFKSRDGGGSWYDASSGLGNRSALALAVDPRMPTTVFAGTATGLFKSLDGARTWSSVGSTLPSSAIRALAIDPVSPSTVYASAAGTIFKSTDGGSSWSRGDSGIRQGGVVVIAIDPQTPTTLYAGSFDGAFKSVDGGASWTLLNGLYTVGSYIPHIVIDSHTPTTLYASNFSGRTVFKSIDGGVTWSSNSTGLSGARVFRLAIDPMTPSTLYAGTTGGVFKSTDGGSNWSIVSNGLIHVRPLDVIALAIASQSPATLLAGFRGPGIFKSTDGGGSWAVVNTGLVNTAVSSVALDLQSPDALYASTNSGVHRSTDAGDTWSILNTELYASALAPDPQMASTLYAGGYTSTGSQGIFKSTDGGERWSLIGLSGIAVSSVVINPSSPNILYVGTTSSDGVFRSLDSGATWSAVNFGLTARNVWALAIDPQNPSTVYAGTGYNYPDICRAVFKSTDAGSSWVELGPHDRSISAVAVDPQTPTTLYASSNQFACSGGGPQDPGVYKSTDGGASWVAVNSRLTTTLAIDAHTPATVYAGTGASGVFKSTDGGMTWSDYNSGLTNLAVAAFVVGPTHAYAGTAGGGVSARATPYFTLTVRTTGDGAGSVTSDPAGIDCGSDCDQSYVSGTAVTLRAAPASNAVFTGWNGCNTHTGSSCTVTMGSARFVTARFDLQRFDLTVIRSGLGRGYVISRPTGIVCGSDCSEPYAVDTTVTLTATARFGIVTSWDGCDTDSGRGRRSRCTVTINTDRSVTVYFVGRPPTVTPTQRLPP